MLLLAFAGVGGGVSLLLIMIIILGRLSVKGMRQLHSAQLDMKLKSSKQMPSDITEHTARTTNSRNYQF